MSFKSREEKNTADDKNNASQLVKDGIDGFPAKLGTKIGPIF
jgi:hypothetical protein